MNLRGPKTAFSTEVDDFFRDNVQHLFLYITNRCDLRCEQCFYANQLGQTEMDLALAKRHIERFSNLGARKLTLLGGEPTLYDLKNNWSGLRQIIEQATLSGYEHVRIDTNGQFSERFFGAIESRNGLELSFSLDGSETENDRLRGKGVYKRAQENIRDAIRRNYRVSVTICVSRRNAGALAEDVSALAGLGVTEFNFHPLLRVGNHQDVAVNDSFITLQDWSAARDTLTRLSEGRSDLNLRVPPRGLSAGDAELSGHYCSLRSRDRAHVQPNGEIRICPLSVGGQYRTASVKAGVEQLEIADSEDRVLGTRRCVVEHLDYGAFVPTCVSWKPALAPRGEPTYNEETQDA